MNISAALPSCRQVTLHMPLCIMYNIPDEFSSALRAIAGRKSSFGSSIFILFLFRVCIGGVLLLLSQKKKFESI